MKRLCLFFLTINLLANAQKAVTLETIQDNFINQLSLFPQEKIHVHTDKTMYVLGETIWFQAYVVDAFSHQLRWYSQYVYVELINSSDELVTRVKISCDENGLFQGYLFLGEKIPEGDYTLRAYTRYMETLGDEYFFKKNIRIGNLIATEKETKKQARPDYDISFYPEGGNFPEGIMTRVAFKALNATGASESITGEIVDKEGNIIREVETVFAGMGSFTISPEPGKEYFLLGRNSEGQEKRFKIPPAKKSYTLGASYINNRHNIYIVKSPDLPQQPLYLLLHCKGLSLYFEAWNYQNEFISFLSDQFPSGVIQAVLFDEQMNPISERLLFNQNDDQAQLVFSSDKPYYQKREKVVSEISVTDTEGNPLSSHVSIAVTDNQDIAIDTACTILSSLLLSSELRGFIESPGYYFQQDKQAAFALEHLMMTHGWRRYETPEVIKGNYRYSDTGFEETTDITGSVKSILLQRPVVNSDVMYISSDGLAGYIETDSAGMFRFQLHFPDSVKFFVESKNQRGKNGVELILDKENFPNLKHIPNNFSSVDSATSIDYIKKAGERAKYDDNMMLINLDEVVVTATRIDKKDEIRMQYWQNWGSDVTVYREDFGNITPIRVEQFLFGIAGVTVSNGQISIRGMPPPLIIIDGVVWEGGGSPLDMLTAEEIESVDVHKGASGSIFGVRGSNGVVSFTTRRGTYDPNPRNVKPNSAIISPKGYQRPVEFYAPKYDTQMAKNSVIPDNRTTIFWEPNLTVSDEGKASFEFYTSDFQTIYSIVIEGITEDGKIIRKVETIEVRR